MIKAFLVVLTLIPMIGSAQSTNYLDYHREILKAEEQIAARQFSESLSIYRNLTNTYEHVFLRDIKVAAQLSAYVNDDISLFYFLERGMKKGWTSKKIVKLELLKQFKKDDRWKMLKENEDQFRTEFENSINLQLREEMKKMLAEDQKRAIKVALMPVKKWRDRYTNRKFVPTNRAQVRRINQIIDQVGYPGEKIIGDNSWAMVIISHNQYDTIYNQLRPKLYSAFQRGQLSAIELAQIETWRKVVDSDSKDQAFVIWEQEIDKNEALRADSLRSSVGLRSIELNNRLIDIENELKMRLFLSPSHGGRITVKQ